MVQFGRVTYKFPLKRDDKVYDALDLNCKYIGCIFGEFAQFPGTLGN